MTLTSYSEGFISFMMSITKSKMKILYAVQRTGNGHIARAQEIIPILQKYGEVEVIASGSNAQLSPGFEINYLFQGISLFYGKSGRLSIMKSFFNNNYFSFLKAVFLFPVRHYDLIINDFEPVSAWAAKIKGGNIISLSHQAALFFPETPVPKRRDWLAYQIIRFYAPCKIKYGFHFKSYHKDIFQPFVRSKIKNLTPTTEEKYLVYLPAYSDDKIFKTLFKISTKWVVFSKHTKIPYRRGNCQFNPIGEELFLMHLASCKGVLCNAGFELPTEAMYLKKKLFVIPIRLQLEQEYNALAAVQLGARKSKKLKFELLRDWVTQEQTIKFEACENTMEIMEEILQKHVPLKHNSAIHIQPAIG